MYQNDVKQQAGPYVKRQHKRSIWHKIVRFMACIVVFCTTYALILPAITAEKEYFCGMEAHEHTEECYRPAEVAVEYLCGLEESEGHAHGEDCYGATEGHSHDEACYDSEAALICELEETPSEEILLCELEEQEGHTHGEECMVLTDAEPVLVCELQEHIHEDTCLTDASADLEIAEDWEGALEALELSGSWTEDIVAVAQSQLGYKESEQNYLSDDGVSRHGYTRYGEWYGIPYGDWDAMFASFCLNYAGVPAEKIPQESDSQQWFETLQDMGMIHNGETKAPAVGDLLFFGDESGAVSSVAIVAEVSSDNETTVSLRVIEGDYENEVALRYVDISKASILGYCSVDAEPVLIPEAPVVQSVETENYIVTVSHGPELVLPEGAELRVIEYAKDSEIFRQRCEEIGIQLDWLLNIGFYVGEEELELEAAFDVVVTSKQGEDLSNEITHFTDEGAEMIVAEEVTETAEENQTALTFTTPGFSDFGGFVKAVTPRTPTDRQAAVATGSVQVNRLRFYNICDNGSGNVSALAGCVFRIEGKTNGYTATVTSKDEAKIDLPSGIPNGVYTITEVSVPEGYMKDTRPVREFEIRNGILVSDHNIGTFVNHSMERLTAGKTSEVEDYNNRIYQILLNAQSNMEMFQIGPIDVLFVVDQSNSMLFPSGLESTGKYVELNKNGWYNTNRMEDLVNWQGLDRNQVYYVIADPHGTSTAWAVWYDYNARTWLCQDASYYAKAYHKNAPGYQDPNEQAIFPGNNDYTYQKETVDGSGRRSNGGGLGKSLVGGSLGNYINNSVGDGYMSFELYTATDEFNRLHYLEEALTNMVYELADANPQNRVTLVGFTREIKVDVGPMALTTSNVNTLVNTISSINTAGGTRQDVALQYTYDRHLGPDASYRNGSTYTILITDGAPVKATQVDNREVGHYNDWPSNAQNASIYSHIKYQAQRVRNESVLMTVGLGLEAVEGGGKVLEQIASDGSYYCAMEDASQMLKNMQNLLFKSFHSTGKVEIRGDVVDEISDSFYPIAWVNKGAGASTGRKVVSQDSTRDWILLEPGDYITLDGGYSAAKAAGQLTLVDGTYTMVWTGANEAEKPLLSGNNPWRGTFYVKAKEDFIGGNAIETNKSAKVTVHGTDKVLDEPTVNVRLLGMNEMNSEVTVYLGDIINESGNSPLDSLKEFYANTEFTKLVSDGGNVMNKVTADDSIGLKEESFTLRYAIGRDLTDDEWQRLMNGDEIFVSYTYDDPSSHGQVGFFSFKLTKTGMEGANPSFEEHEATAACQPNGSPLTGDCEHPAETYTLHITYTAHRLGQGGRPSMNFHNGSGSPGTQVGLGATLETGLGRIELYDTHEVHVISGSIEIIKKFDSGVTDPADRTFSFILHRVEDGEDTSRDVTRTITIPAGQTQGAANIVFDGLRRGTYTVTEAVDTNYTVKDITVLDSSNCYSTPAIGASGTELSFTMGSNTSNANVIGRAAEEDPYTSYIDPVNGVYGAAIFTNKPIVYEGEVPVRKVWDDGEGAHYDDSIYVVLYKDGFPVLDADGRAKLLKVDMSTNWKGIFTVILANKDDKVSNYDYSIREVSEISDEALHDWHPAVLENDGTTVLYYEEALEIGDLVGVNGRGYMVVYDKDADGTLVVENNKASALPATGGHGTKMYTFGGLALLGAACLMYNYRGKEDRE